MSWCNAHANFLPSIISLESIFFHFQIEEPVLLLGKEKFAGVDVRIRVRGGGHVAQIYGELATGNSFSTCQDLWSSDCMNI